MTTNSAAAVRSGMSIAINCLSTLLPASLTLVRTDIITSSVKRTLLTLPRVILATLMPQLMLFAAVTDFGRAWIIQHRVNTAAKACFNLYPPPRPTAADTSYRLQAGPRPLWYRVSYQILLAFTRLVSPLRSNEPDVYDMTSHPKYPCKFKRWTLTHGFYVAMGGLRVARPRDLNDNPLVVEEQKIAKSDFLAPHRILELVERPGDAYGTARFDLLAQVGVTPVSQVLEANNMSLSIFGLRLLYFVAKVFERRHAGLAVAPLEVLTVAHVLMAFCITAFWWCKPSYLKEGVVLDNLIVEQGLPGVSEELRARAAGRPVQDAYTRPSRWGLRPWHRPDDNYLTLRGAANYRALIVFPLCICYATIPLLPTWELQFPNPTYLWLWRGSLSVLCGFGALITVLTLLDTSARLLATHCASFRTFWGSEDDRGTRSGNTVAIRRYVNYMLYFIAGVALICMAVMYVVAAVGFQKIPRDALIAGTNIWAF